MERILPFTFSLHPCVWHRRTKETQEPTFLFAFLLFSPLVCLSRKRKRALKLTHNFSIRHRKSLATLCLFSPLSPFELSCLFFRQSSFHGLLENTNCNWRNTLFSTLCQCRFFPFSFPVYDSTNSSLLWSSCCPSLILLPSWRFLDNPESNPWSRPSWIKDTSNSNISIADMESPPLRTDEEGSFTIISAKASDSGWYRCVTDNPVFGHVASFGYYLNVRCKSSSVLMTSSGCWLSLFICLLMFPPSIPRTIECCDLSSARCLFDNTNRNVWLVICFHSLSTALSLFLCYVLLLSHNVESRLIMRLAVLSFLFFQFTYFVTKTIDLKWKRKRQRW